MNLRTRPFRPSGILPLFLLSLLLAGNLVANEMLHGDGLIVAAASAKIPAKTNGFIGELVVKENAIVKKDDAILQLDNQEQKLEMEARKAIAAKAETDAKIVERLYNEKVASRDERDRARVEAQTAKANYDISRLRYENCTVRSPIAGRVLRISKNLGEAVQAHETVAEVADFRQVEILVYLDAAYMEDIHLDDSVLVNETHPAKIGAVDSVVDPGSGIFRVKVMAENSEGLLIPGKRCDVRFPNVPVREQKAVEPVK